MEVRRSVVSCDSHRSNGRKSSQSQNEGGIVFQRLVDKKSFEKRNRR